MRSHRKTTATGSADDSVGRGMSQDQGNTGVGSQGLLGCGSEFQLY